MEIGWEQVGIVAVVFAFLLAALSLLFRWAARRETLDGKGGEGREAFADCISPEPALPPPYLLRNQRHDNRDEDAKRNGARRLEGSP